jgi:PKD repeat protein
MNLKVVKSILFLLCSTTAIFAQNEGENNFKEWDVETYYRNLYPHWGAKMDSAEAALEEFTRTFSANSREGDPYIIPIVFHIVHYNGDENISMEQIEDAVKILNEDFRKLNADTSSIVDEFQEIAADSEIEFRLAQYDPDGNCTNGVVRTVSSGTFNGGENLKDISPIWDRSSYLNVWVSNAIENGAAGYTNYPSVFNGPDGEDEDGIVILHDYIGSIGTGDYGTARALTHEVGHWLNLRHVWGDNNEPGVQCGSDLVDDTPQSIGWTTCNLNGMSCTDGGLDNVQNYMEYSYCCNMFTEGQKTRMLAALNSTLSNRNQLWTDENLAATGVLEDPIFCAADFNAERKIVCAGETITFEDMSYNGASTYSWQFTGANPSNSSDENPSVIYNVPGLYDVILTSGNGIIDQTKTKIGYITVLPNTGVPLPYFEGFENIESVPSENIFVNNFDEDNVWQVTTAAASTGSKSIKLNNNTNTTGEKDEFLSNTIDLSNATDDVVLSFKYAYCKKNSSSDDVLKVYASLNCGDTWSPRATIESDELSTAPNQVSSFVPDSDEWVYKEITNLSSSYFVDGFRFKFEWKADGGNNIYIDDININGTLVSGLSSVENNNLFSLVPNPANNYTVVNVNASMQEMGSIYLTDYTGRKVLDIYAGTLNGKNSFNIPLNDLAKGIYFVTLAASNNSISVKKLIVE